MTLVLALCCAGLAYSADTPHGLAVAAAGTFARGATPAAARSAPVVAYANGAHIGVWNTDSCELMARIPLDAQLCGLLVSPDGRRLMVCRPDRTSQWDTSTGALRWEAPVDRWTTAAACTPDGRYLACADASRVSVFDMDTGQCTRTWRIPAPLDVLACTRDGRTLLGAGPGLVAAWNPTTDDVRWQAPGPGRSANWLLTDDEQHLIAATSVAVEHWQVVDGTHRRVALPEGDGDALPAIRHDGAMVVRATPDRGVAAYDTATGARRPILPKLSRPVRAIAYLPGSRGMVAAGERYPLTCRDDTADDLQPAGRNCPAVENGVLLGDRTLAVPGLTIASLNDTSVLRTLMLTADGVDEKARADMSYVRPAAVRLHRWSLANAPDRPLLLPQFGHSAKVTHLVLGEAGHMLSAAEDGVMAVWDVRAGDKLAAWYPDGAATSVRAMLALPDARHVIVAPSDASPLIVDLAARSPVRCLSGAMGCARALASDRAGRLVLGIDAALNAVLWDAASGDRLWRVADADGVSAAAISPDGDLLATANRCGVVRLWDVATRRRRFAVTSSQPRQDIVRLGFSADGRWLVAWAAGGRVVAWDTTTDQAPRVLDAGPTRPRYSDEMPSTSASSLAGDGTVVAVQRDGSHDVYVVEIATGRACCRITGLSYDRHRRKYFDPAMSPDGRFVVMRGGDAHPSAVAVWDAATGRPVWDDAAMGDTPPEPRGGAGSQYDATCLTFSPDGTRLAFGRYTGGVRMRDLATGTLLLNRLPRYTTPTTQRYHNRGITFAPDSESLFSADGCGAVWQWPFSGSGPVVRLPASRFPHGSAMVSLAPDGAYAFYHDYTGAVLADLATGATTRYPDYFTDIRIPVLAPDCGLAAVPQPARPGQSAELHLLRLADGAVLRTVPLPRDIRAIALSPGGAHAAVLLVPFGPPITSPVVLVDCATGAVRYMRPTYAPPATDPHPDSGWQTRVFLSPDGKTVAITRNGTPGIEPGIHCWDTATGAFRLRSRHESDQLEAFAPDGRMLTINAMPSVGEPLRLAREDDEGPGLVFPISTWSGSITAFSPDGRLLAYSDPGGEVRVCETGGGEELARLPLSSRHPNRLTFSPNGRHLAIGCADGSVDIWDARTRRVACTISCFSDGTWAVTDPDGRYDASNAGDIDGLRWVVNGEVIALRQLKDRYYEPGLLGKALGMNPEPMRDVATLGAVGLFPAVALAPPAADETHLGITLTNRGGGLGAVRVLVNGKELAADARGPGLDPRAAQATLTVDLAGAASVLPGMDNLVEVIAANGDGTLTSRSQAFAWKAPGTAETRAPDLYAIVVGTSVYAGGGLRLAFAAKDAEDFADAVRLGAERLFGPTRTHVTTLTTAGGDRPTKARLQAVFAQVARQARPGDVLVVYLAGHGAMLPGRQDGYAYLTCEARSMADLEDAGVRTQVAVTSDELQAWCTRIPALKQVLVLDTCAAGAAAARLAERREVSGDQIRAIERLKDRTGVHVLMGCAATARSYETSRYGQGLLTYALLQGMKGAALRAGSFVDVSTLFAYAADQVPALAQGVGGIQRPVVAAPRGASFDVGELSPEDRARMRVASPKPLVLRPRLLDPRTVGDPLGLTELLRARLRALHEAPGAALVFVDADDLTGALAPRGVYTVDGATVTATLRLWRDDAEAGTVTVTGPAANPAGLADALAQAMAREVGR